MSILFLTPVSQSRIRYTMAAANLIPETMEDSSPGYSRNSCKHMQRENKKNYSTEKMANHFF